MSSREVIRPTPEEIQRDSKRTRVVKGEAFAANDIPPFTRVSICYGRMFKVEEHDALFKGDDPMMQWAVKLKKQPMSDGKRVQRWYLQHGWVVTPYLPAGFIDDQYKKWGDFIYFYQAEKGQDPTCIYVINFLKGRVEYWTGLGGCRASEKLTLDYKANPSKNELIYVLYGGLYMPRSLNEMASSESGRRLLVNAFGYHKNTKLFDKWAKMHSPWKVQPRYNTWNKDNDDPEDPDSVHTYLDIQRRMNYRARKRRDDRARELLYRYLKDRSRPVRWIPLLRKPFHEHWQSRVALTNVMNGCKRLESLADDEVFRLARTVFSMYGIMLGNMNSINGYIGGDEALNLLYAALSIEEAAQELIKISKNYITKIRKGEQNSRKGAQALIMLRGDLTMFRGHTGLSLNEWKKLENGNGSEFINFVVRALRRLKPTQGTIPLEAVLNHPEEWAAKFARMGLAKLCARQRVR